MQRSDISAVSRATRAMAILAILVVAAVSCSPGGSERQSAEAPAPTSNSTPDAEAVVTALPEPDATPLPPVAVHSATPPPTAPAETSPIDNPQLVLGGDEFQQASFPGEAAALAIEVLGEPTGMNCRAGICTHYEWDLPEHGSRFTIEEYGWALWGEPLITSIDDRFTFAGIDGDPTDITTLTATEPYAIFYSDGRPSQLCSLTLCFGAAARISRFGPEDADRITLIQDRAESVDGRAIVIGDDPVPFYIEPSPAYTVAQGQEVWILPGFLSINGTHWVDVITDDHRSFGLPMDRLVRVGERVDMLTALRAAQDNKTALLVGQFGPLDVLELRFDGVGPVDMGGSAADAVDIAIAALGEPSYHVTTARSSPGVNWTTDGDSFWLDISGGVLGGWHVGDQVNGDGPPASPLGAMPSISFEGAPVPLVAAELDFEGPWGIEGTEPSQTIRSASGVNANVRDGLIIQLWTRGSSSVTESWLSEPMYELSGSLDGLTVGDRVWVDSRMTDRAGWREGMAFVFTEDHRAGWVSEFKLTTEQP